MRSTTCIRRVFLALMAPLAVFALAGCNSTGSAEPANVSLVAGLPLEKMLKDTGFSAFALPEERARPGYVVAFPDERTRRQLVDTSLGLGCYQENRWSKSLDCSSTGHANNSFNAGFLGLLDLQITSEEVKTIHYTFNDAFTLDMRVQEFVNDYTASVGDQQQASWARHDVYTSVIGARSVTIEFFASDKSSVSVDVAVNTESGIPIPKEIGSVGTGNLELGTQLQRDGESTLRYTSPDDRPLIIGYRHEKLGDLVTQYKPALPGVQRAVVLLINRLVPRREEVPEAVSLGDLTGTDGIGESEVNRVLEELKVSLPAQLKDLSGGRTTAPKAELRCRLAPGNRGTVGITAMLVDPENPESVRATARIFYQP